MKQFNRLSVLCNVVCHAGAGLFLVLFLALLHPGLLFAAQTSEIAIPTLRGITASEGGSITLKWNKVDGATEYEIARAKKGSEDYTTIAKTRGISYRDTTGKPGKTYCYRVRAITPQGESEFCPQWEKKCRKEPERIAYVGDSVMSGFEAYGVLEDPKEQSFAVVNRTIEVVNQEDLPQVLAYAPDRVFFMVGTNNCMGNAPDDQLKPSVKVYADMLDRIHEAYPETEIVVMGIGPARNDQLNKDTVKRYNSMLQKLVGERDFCYYYDTGKKLRSAKGRLKEEYATQDGIHWQKPAYDAVYADLQRCIKEW